MSKDQLLRILAQLVGQFAVAIVAAKRAFYDKERSRRDNARRLAYAGLPAAYFFSAAALSFS